MIKIEDLAGSLKEFRDQGVVNMIPTYFEEKEYRDYDALSQSFLKRQGKSIQEIFREVDPDSPHIRMGNIVDDMLSLTDKDFHNKYMVSKAEKPTEKLKLFIDQVVNISSREYNNSIFSLGLGIREIIFSRACQDSDYGKKMKSSTLYSKVESFSDYVEELYQASDKISITQQEYENALGMVKNMVTSKFTKHYFYTKAEALAENKLIVYQLPIFFKFEGVNCKGLIDMLIVQFNDKGDIDWVMPIDFKTTSRPLLETVPNVLAFRYDIQAYFYTQGLERLLMGVNIKPFKFIFCETIPPDFNCDVLQVTLSVMEHAEYGNQRNLKGIVELVNYYKFYQENGYEVEFDRHREDYKEPLKIDVENGFIV